MLTEKKKKKDWLPPVKRKGSLWTASRSELQYQLFSGSPACQLTLNTLILPFSIVQFLKINLNRWCSDRQTDGKTDWSILLVCERERERGLEQQCELCEHSVSCAGPFIHGVFFNKSRLHYYTICSQLSVEPWIQRAKCKVIHGFSTVQGSVLLMFLLSCSRVNCRDRWTDR